MLVTNGRCEKEEPLNVVLKDSVELYPGVSDNCVTRDPFTSFSDDPVAALRV